eukprot:symbB.v1.2.032765.t2/scaffold3849.1/size49308/2
MSYDSYDCYLVQMTKVLLTSFTKATGEHNQLAVKQTIAKGGPGTAKSGKGRGGGKKNFICAFDGASSANKEPDAFGILTCFYDIEWGDYDSHGNPSGRACFKCKDILCRIRPELTIDQAEESFTSGKPQDVGLVSDFNAALEQYDQVGATDATFKPGANVDHQMSFGYTIFQDFGLLTESEFKAVIGAEPKDVGMKSTKGKKFEHQIEWAAPGESNNMYLVSLDGLSPIELATVRKIRLEVKKAAIHADAYLRPSDQLLANQGQHVFGHVFKMMADKRPMSASLQASTPESVGSLRKKVQDQREQAELAACEFRNRSNEWLQQPDAEPGFDGEDDSFAQLMMDDLEGDGGADDRRRPRRQAGFATGTVQGQAAAPKKKRKTHEDDAASVATSTATGGATLASSHPSTTTSERLPAAIADAEAPSAMTVTNSSLLVRQTDAESSLGKSTKDAKDLCDEEMRQVAEKHGGATTLKSLTGLTCEAYLQEPGNSKRYHLASKLRGAKTIADSLEKSGQKHAAQTLRDRMAACSACDLLVTKDTRRMEPQKMQQLLLSCEEAWPIFTVTVKNKLFENHLVTVQLPDWLKYGTSKNVQEQTKIGSDLGHSISISPFDKKAVMGFERFDYKSPTMHMVFHAHIVDIQTTMEDLGLLGTKDASDQTLSMDIEEAKQNQKTSKQSDYPEMEILWKRSEAGGWASGLEPKRDQIKWGISILKDLCGMKGSDSPLPKFAQVWTSIISCGTILISGNAKMRGVVDDLSKFFAGDGLTTLKTMVDQRSKLLECSSSLEKLHDSFQSRLDPADASNTSMLDLLSMPLPSAFQSELDSQQFDDAVSYKAAAHLGVLREAELKYATALKTFLTKKAQDENSKLDADPSYNMLWMPEQSEYDKVPFALSEEGEMNWKAKITKDTPFAEVHEAAKSTILTYLPAMAIKEYADTIVQVVDEVENFMSTFSNQTSSDGAADSLSKLGESFEDAVKSAKIAQIFLIEVFLLKGLNQHISSLNKGDEGHDPKGHGYRRHRQGRPLVSSDATAAAEEWTNLGLETAPIKSFVSKARFMSLGSYCGVAQALQSLGFRGEAGPFDWMRTRVEAVTRLVETDFEETLKIFEIFRRRMNHFASNSVIIFVPNQTCECVQLQWRCCMTMQDFFHMEMPFTRHCGTRIFPMSWGGSHWHHDFDDEEAWKVWKSMESCGAAWVGSSDWANHLQSQVKKTMERRKERFLSPGEENIVFIRAVNSTEELLAIPHLFQALKRRFSRSHVRLLVLVDHQDVESNAVTKDLGNDVIFSSANGSVWESYLNIPETDPRHMRTRMEWASDEYCKCIATALKTWTSAGGYSLWPSLASYKRWLCPFVSPDPKWEAFRGQRVGRVPAVYTSFQAATSAAQLQSPLQATVMTQKAMDIEDIVKGDHLFHPMRQLQRRTNLGLETAPIKNFWSKARFMSLGSYCGVAQALQSLGFRGEAGPFDWMRTRVEAVTRLVETDFEETLKIFEIFRRRMNHFASNSVINFVPNQNCECVLLQWRCCMTMQDFFHMEMPFTRHCGTRIFPMSWGGSHWHHDFDDEEAWKVWKSMESCGAAWVGSSDWANHLQSQVKKTMERRKERFLSAAEENLVFIRAVNSTEELLAIPHLFQALKRRFSRSHVRLLVLVDHQDVESNAVTKDLGNDVIFSSANGSVWESYLNIPETDPRHVATVCGPVWRATSAGYAHLYRRTQSGRRFGANELHVPADTVCLVFSRALILEKCEALLYESMALCALRRGSTSIAIAWIPWRSRSFRLDEDQVARLVETDFEETLKIFEIFRRRMNHFASNSVINFDFFHAEMPFTRHCGTRIFPMSWGGSHWHHDFDDEEVKKTMERRKERFLLRSKNAERISVSRFFHIDTVKKTMERRKERFLSESEENLVFIRAVNSTEELLAIPHLFQALKRRISRFACATFGYYQHQKSHMRATKASFQRLEITKTDVASNAGNVLVTGQRCHFLVRQWQRVGKLSEYPRDRSASYAETEPRLHGQRDLRTLFRRPAVCQPVTTIQARFVSLGSYCGVAQALQSLGFRGEAGPFDWMRTRCEAVKKTMERRKERFLSESEENLVFVRAVNSTEELLAIPHLFQALKRRFSRSHVRLLVLVDHQDVASNAIAKDLGNDVIFSSANGSVWESFLSIPEKDPQHMRTRMEWASDEYCKCIATALKTWTSAGGYSLWPSLASYKRWLCPFVSPDPKWEAFRGQRIARVPAVYTTFQAATSAAQLRIPVQATVGIIQNHWIAGGRILRRV